MTSVVSRLCAVQSATPTAFRVHQIYANLRIKSGQFRWQLPPAGLTAIYNKNQNSADFYLLLRADAHEIHINLWRNCRRINIIGQIITLDYLVIYGMLLFFTLSCMIHLLVEKTIFTSFQATSVL